VQSFTEVHSPPVTPLRPSPSLASSGLPGFSPLGNGPLPYLRAEHRWLRPLPRSLLTSLSVPAILLHSPQVGPYTLPKDIPLFMSIFSAHHNADVWPRVEDFVPERFLPVSPTCLSGLRTGFRGTSGIL
jgi:hypothetical protein